MKRLGWLTFLIFLLCIGCAENNENDFDGDFDPSSVEDDQEFENDTESIPPDGDDESEYHGTVTVSGHAFRMTYEVCTFIEGAEVCVNDDPSHCTATDADGFWSFSDLPNGTDVFFVLRAPEYTPIQTATFFLDGEDIDHVSFQVPDSFLFDVFEYMVGTEADPEKCQISTTITAVGLSLYDCVHHGVEGATATIEPSVPPGHGPIYFTDRTLPDPELTETSIDGGVVFINVDPGEYLLYGHKDGMAFKPARATCRPGILVNPSPPKGIQAIEQ